MRKSRLSWHKQGQLIELFVAGATARTAASLVGVNKATASYYFHRLRQLIETQSEAAGWLAGEIEIDESYWGGQAEREAGARRPRESAGLWAVKARRQGVDGGHPECKGPDLTADHSWKSPAG